jgi:hypothetical protein
MIIASHCGLKPDVMKSAVILRWRFRERWQNVRSPRYFLLALKKMRFPVLVSDAPAPQYFPAAWKREPDSHSHDRLAQQNRVRDLGIGLKQLPTVAGFANEPLVKPGKDELLACPAKDELLACPAKNEPLVCPAKDELLVCFENEHHVCWDERHVCSQLDVFRFRVCERPRMWIALSSSLLSPAWWTRSDCASHPRASSDCCRSGCSSSCC